ncbi:hypothetical protein SAMN03159341_103137 [Paenibacillus sp. 1_12]|uniref:CehA/McbA family metallohydrolase n=1 Tax=Paenibacillus sp. 1_12 TaxID=1566278 RepID=UPI0008F0AAF4|nr:CehA/McbA family metallohydrolase [Paenibacillus sp. 1_12]SFL08636.1 hypothetical protein SAMN03159341_103137 [Paenibacillus sp. 1_12]
MNQTDRHSQTATFTREVKHSEQSSYIEVPFEVPQHVEEIQVSYEVESSGSHIAVIDLGIRDPYRIRGWSGGARKFFNIGLEKATPGYLPGPLDAGGWAVVHNAYKIPQEGCKVTITIIFFLMTPRWLKGDLHMHSLHSDGTYTLEENAAIMEELGCDFMTMTDHNAISQNFAYPRSTSLVMIPGMEFTTNFGHSNFLGVADPLDDFRVSTQADVNERLATARERGARIVLNHPHCDFCPWEWDFDVDFDWVEIWNGPWTERNERTLAWWQQQLLAGKRLNVIGGSDVHRPDPYVKHAMPCTWVYASSKTVKGILAGIEKGNVSISFAPQGPFVQLGFGNYKMGDSVPAGEAGIVCLQAEHLLAGDEVKLISSSGLEQNIIVDSDGTLELTIDSVGRRFVRAEVWRTFPEVDNKLMAALTNPIYFDENKG